MKFLLDQGLPRSAVQELADFGVVAEHVGDLGMSRSTDAQILEEARRRHSIVVTLDADFHQQLAGSHAQTPSVVRIRIEGLKGHEVAAILLRVIAAASAELTSGAAVSVTESRIRIRLLPIGRSTS